MSKKKGKVPVPGKVSQIKVPKVANEPATPTTWSFSFRYFGQRKYFGLDRTEPKWFVSLLVRLKELSEINKDEFDRQQHLRDNARYHIVNWDAKNCPIRRSDIESMPPTYRNNEIEYPLFQFDIGKAFGRIIGFWNETSTVFHIVLLDPLHNMHPHKIVDYRVRECYPLGSEYADLNIYLERVRTQRCEHENCGYRRQLESQEIHPFPENMVIAYLDDTFLAQKKRILRQRSVSEILEAGILALTE
jgi:hypothetical protein